MAIEAYQVGGYKAAQILKLADGVSATGSELNSAAWTELLALLNGTTTQYLKAGAATFTAAPQWSGVPSGANDLVNKTYVDAQVSAGLPNVGAAGTYTKVVTDVKGRVTSGSALAESDIPTLSTAGQVSGSAINTGTIGGNASINSTGNLVTTGTVQGAVVGVTNLRVFNGANYVQLAAPALGSNLNFILPAADGAAGTVMKTNGSGQLSFGALSSGDIPNLDAAKITTGTLPVARGGTGLTSFGNNSVLVSNGTGSAVNSLNCTLGQVVKFDASGFAGCGTDSTGSGSQWTTNGSDIYYTTGNVGIGTTSPTSSLEIATGDLKVTNGGVQTKASGPNAMISTNLANANLLLSGGYPSATTPVIGLNSAGNFVNGSYEIGSGAFQGMQVLGSYASFFGFTYDPHAPLASGGDAAGLYVRDMESTLYAWGEPRLEIDNDAMGGLDYRIWSDSTVPRYVLSRSRGTYASSSFLLNNDQIGGLSFSNRGDWSGNRFSASVDAFVDNDSGFGDIPGRLEFKTAPDGSATPITRLTIKSNGNIGIGTTSPTAKLHLPAGTAAANTAPLKFEPTAATKMTIAENGAMEPTFRTLTL